MIRPDLSDTGWYETWNHGLQLPELRRRHTPGKPILRLLRFGSCDPRVSGLFWRRTHRDEALSTLRSGDGGCRARKAGGSPVSPLRSPSDPDCRRGSSAGFMQPMRRPLGPQGRIPDDLHARGRAGGSTPISYRPGTAAGIPRCQAASRIYPVP